MKLIFTLAAVLITGNSSGFAAESNDPQTLYKLFDKLQGQWTCEGAFANGKALAANITISTQYDGKILFYRHEDLPPNTYKAIGQWAYDKTQKMMVALHDQVIGSDTYVAGYVAESWTDTKLTFNAKALWDPLWAENRFTYEITGANKMTMVWDKFKDDKWQMGDYLNCAKPIG